MTRRLGLDDVVMSAAMVQSETLACRRRLRVRGQVQGVGFRPFVFRLAGSFHLTGFVRNAPEGVIIEIQGSAEALDAFMVALRAEVPMLAAIRELDSQNVDPSVGETEFRIIESEPGLGDGASTPEVTVDTAVCDACVEELLSPVDRRRGYALINCTNCGPRYSIVRSVPYDRPNTTMSGFEMCPACKREYTEPADRRFHAQPIACHDCGPKLHLIDPAGNVLHGDAIVATVKMLLDGKVIAIKGLGGFHLAVRADSEEAVHRLRKLKGRETKPLAVMCRSIEQARKLADLSDRAIDLMRSPHCPIVLAPRKPDTHIAANVAQGTHRLGVLLPYTPIHHLLFAVPESSKMSALVMTSGNATDEPLVIDNADAIARLGSRCDAMLLHDRPIERGVDDSVIIDTGESFDPIPIRRARGYAPASLSLPLASEAHGVAVGGELKSAVAVVRDGRAILSQHLGDLTHPRAYHGFRKTIDDLQALFDVQPRWVAIDAHPMYLSHAYGKSLADKFKVPTVVVQHHHAHAASVMAENGVDGQVLAVVCDGTGFGDDGTIWGGELLVADLLSYQRVARLRPLRLPGGDASATDTRRCALALLFNAYGPDDFESHVRKLNLIHEDDRRTMLCKMIRDDVRCSASSSAGRVFDGIAALLGLCDHNHFEAQSALSLESAASQCPQTQMVDHPLFELHAGTPAEIDLSPLVREIVKRREHHEPAAKLAALFHDAFAAAWDAVVSAAVDRSGLLCVALSGGVFCNERLTKRLSALLEARGLHVLRHRVVPPNDGGLALGQAAIASARFAAASSKAPRQGGV